MLKKKIWSNFQRIIELFIQKIVTKLRKKPIPDPGSRGNKGTGSRIRIRNTAFYTRQGGRLSGGSWKHFIRQSKIEPELRHPPSKPRPCKEVAKHFEVLKPKVCGVFTAIYTWPWLGPWWWWWMSPTFSRWSNWPQLWVSNPPAPTFSYSSTLKVWFSTTIVESEWAGGDLRRSGCDRWRIIGDLLRFLSAWSFLVSRFNWLEVISGRRTTLMSPSAFFK